MNNNKIYQTSVIVWKNCQRELNIANKLIANEAEKVIGYQMGLAFLNSTKDKCKECDEARAVARNLVKNLEELTKQIVIKDIKLERLKAACLAVVEADDSESQDMLVEAIGEIRLALNLKEQ